MEKLLKLLNEHAHTYADHYDDTGEEITIEFYAHADECFQYVCDGSYETLVDDVVISKRYGFIGWLIENKKIKPYKAYEGFLYGGSVEFVDGPTITSVNRQLYDSILCALALSDEPIELLISILK